MSKGYFTYETANTHTYIMYVHNNHIFVFSSEFIDPSAPHMVNLSAIAFEEATKDLENPQRYAFAAAEVRLPTHYNLLSHSRTKMSFYTAHNYMVNQFVTPMFN